MKTITLGIDKEYSCDVLVCGGGMSGFSAAVAAARSGASVILIESGGFLGGTATKGLVGPFMTCYDKKGEHRIIKGLFTEICERMEKAGGSISHTKCFGGESYSGYRTAGHIGVTPFNHECLKLVSEKMCLEAGVKLLYHTVMIGCEKDGERITKVYAANSNQVITISAKAFIDTTGTAALAAKAGAEVMRGNDDGILQTASTFFIISGVDKAALDTHMEQNTEMRAHFMMDLFERGQEDGSFPCGTQKLRIYEMPNGNWIVNMAQVDGQFNELDGDELTKAEIDQREQIQHIFAFLKKNVVGLENIKLLQTASDIGLRESRRMVGMSTLSLDDLLSARKFDDRIAVCANSIDIHQKKGVNYVAHDGSNYYIPLSALISKSLDNLLTAGKSLSADKFAFAAVRVMPPCVAMGEAAGVTAALAAKSDMTVKTVNYKDVQAELVKRGAFLD